MTNCGSPTAPSYGLSRGYKRHRTTTPFAALDVATGDVKVWHLFQEPAPRVSYFGDRDRESEAGNPSDSRQSEYEQLNQDGWLKLHPQVHLHDTPTYSSWLNRVEWWFSILIRAALRDASFTAPRQLRDAAAIVQSYNRTPHLLDGPKMISGFSVSQIVHMTAVYSLAEHLGRRPVTPAEIAAAESLSIDATFRLMRVCASIGLLTQERDSRFAATPLLNTLHKDDAKSLRGSALMMPSSVNWLPWGRLSTVIKTGEPQAVATLGCSVWEYLAAAPSEAEVSTEVVKSSFLRV